MKKKKTKAVSFKMKTQKAKRNRVSSCSNLEFEEVVGIKEAGKKWV